MGRVPTRALAQLHRHAATRAQIARALAQLHRHPRHLLLGALVAGLLTAPVASRIVLLIAVTGAVASGRVGLGLAVAAAVLAGAIGAQARLAALDRSVLGPLLGTTVSARVTLLEQPRHARYGSLALAQVEGIERGSTLLADGVPASPGPSTPVGNPAPAPPIDRARGERVLLRIRERTPWPPVATGAIVQVTGRLRLLGPFEQYERRRGAHAALRVDAAFATGSSRGGAWRLVDVIRGRAEGALDAGLAAPQAALLRGMVLGQDAALSERTRADFRTAGLSHLMAASGQNVALLVALALPLLAWAGVGLQGRLLGVLALIALYVPLAGAGPSIQRAGVMGAARTVAALAGRPASRWYALLLAAAVTLALNPRTSADPGWQLSFAAVVAIALLAPATRAALLRRRVRRWLAEAIAVTVAATLGTAPLIAFHFSQLSLVALPANVLAAPAVAPIMWLGLLAAALGQVAATLALPLNALNAYLLGYVGWVAHAAAALPHASVPLAVGGPATLVAAYAALALLGVLVRRRRGAPI